MRLRVLSVPYDSGFRGRRMGAGPERLLELGLVSQLREAGHEVEAETIELPPGNFPAEVFAGFELSRLLADGVRSAVKAGAIPIVLGGNCLSAVGTLAGLGSDMKVLWFDAHADFNTPTTSSSGFLDGMALSIVTDHCWESLATSVSGFRPIPETSVVLLGAREFDPVEAELLEHSGIGHIEASTPPVAIAEYWRNLSPTGRMLTCTSTWIRSIRLSVAPIAMPPPVDFCWTICSAC